MSHVAESQPWKFLIRVDVEQQPRQHPDGNLSLLFRFRDFSAFPKFGVEGLKAGVGSKRMTHAHVNSWRRACAVVRCSFRRFPTCGRARARLGWSGTNNLWDLEDQEALGDRCYIVKSPLPFSGETKNQDCG